MNATLAEYQLKDDSDDHVVLSDGAADYSGVLTLPGSLVPVERP